MSENIIKVLDELGKRFGIAIDWSSENVTPYLQSLMSRFITNEIITSAILITSRRTPVTLVVSKTALVFRVDMLECCQLRHLLS